MGGYGRFLSGSGGGGGSSTVSILSYLYFLEGIFCYARILARCSEGDKRAHISNHPPFFIQFRSHRILEIHSVLQ